MSRASQFQYRRNRVRDIVSADHHNWNYPSTSTRSRSSTGDRANEQTHLLTKETCNDMDVEKLSLDKIEGDGRYSENIVNALISNQTLNTTGNPFPLSSLPTDTLLRVFSFLEKNEQLRMSVVCKSWRQLIFSSACLWRKRQLTLRCSRQSGCSRNAFFYARRLGRYLRKLSVACEHPSNHACRTMAISFRRLMTGLKVPTSLRSFKVTDLRLSQARASVLLDISSALERFIYSLQHLKCFQMSNAHWPAQEGLRVMSSVLTSCQDSLHTLRIDGFFRPKFVPPRAALDVLTPGLACLKGLRKLSIDYFYLNDQTVLALASGRQGQLRSLKLVATDIGPNLRFVSRAAWLALTRSCPSMRVEFVVQGFTISPSISLPLLLCPVLRVHKLCLNIGNHYIFLDTPRLNMAAVLSHVTRHFRRRLTRFELDIDNHNDRLDTALIRLVRKSRHLISVKVKAYFNSPDTDLTLRQILRERRDKYTGRQTGRGRANPDATNHEVTTTEVVTEEDGGVTSGPSSSDTPQGPNLVQENAQPAGVFIPGNILGHSGSVFLPESTGSGDISEQRGNGELVTLASTVPEQMSSDTSDRSRAHTAYGLRPRTSLKNNSSECMPSTSTKAVL